MKKITILILSLVVALAITAKVFAQTPSVIPSPTAVSTPSPATTENLRDRIEKIVQEQKDKVQSLLGQAAVERQGFIGQVVRVSQETVTLDNHGTTRVVPLDGVTLLQGTAPVKPETIEIGSWALVLGLKREDSFIPKKIVFSKTSLRPHPHVVYLGSLKAIKTSGVDIQPRGSQDTLTVTLTKATKFQNNAGTATKLSSFVEDDQVLLVGVQTDDTTTAATVIRALAPFNKGT